MKTKKLLLYIYAVVISPFLFCSTQIFSQNIAINTDGSSAQTGVMLDIKGVNAKLTTATQNVFQVKSNDAAYQLKLRLILGTNATNTSLYGGLEVVDSTSGTLTYRALALQPNGGNVGIGTTNPGALLHIVGTTDKNLINERVTSAVSTLGGIIINRRARGVIGGLTTVLTGDELGKYAFAGYDGSNYLITAMIDAVANGVIAAGSIPTDITFNTGSTDLGYVERMRILSAGNVGIGTTAPSWPLSVVKAQNAETVIQVNNLTAGASSAAGLVFTNDANTVGGNIFLNSSANSGWAGVNSLNLYNNVNGPISFGTGANLERMRIDVSGNVGINQTVPAAKLEVDGTSGSTLKIVDTNQGAGKVLTSDASGNASWQAASGGTCLTYTTQTFNASGTWTKPAGVTIVFVEVWGAGGGGGGGAGDASYAGGGGGGASGFYIKRDNIAVVGNVAVTVGTGGGGGAGAVTACINSTAGTAGTSSSFGTFVVAPGGAGGGKATVCGGSFGGTGGGTNGVGGAKGDNSVPCVSAKGGDGNSNFSFMTFQSGGGGGGAVCTGNASGGAGGSILGSGNGGAGGGGTRAGGGGGGSTVGYDGGAGGPSTGNGAAGGIGCGGGGGGANNTPAGFTGGTGGAGQVIVYWYQ